jgi:hypothetical protein
MKETAGVEVKLRQIYLSEHRSNHPTALHDLQTKPNYKAEQPDPPPYHRSSRQREGGLAGTLIEIGRKELIAGG